MKMVQKMSIQINTITTDFSIYNLIYKLLYRTSAGLPVNAIQATQTHNSKFKQKKTTIIIIIIKIIIMMITPL